MEPEPLPTRIADFDHPDIVALIEERGWRGLAKKERLGAIYDFVRNEIPFGYNRRDDAAASSVLRDGLGQCNTKSTLLFALLRALGIQCRVRGMQITKHLQRGALGPLTYALAPDLILHSWVEVQLPDGDPGAWVALEGVIIDSEFLQSVQRRFPDSRQFTGFGIATRNLQTPAVEWGGRATYIQREGVVVDHGTFDDPDSMYAALGTNLGWLRDVVWGLIFLGPLNRRVARLRSTLRSDLGLASGPLVSAKRDC